MRLFFQTLHNVTFVYKILQLLGIWSGPDFIILFEPQAVGIGLTCGRLPDGRVDEHVPQLPVAGALADFFMDEIKKISQKQSQKNKKRDNQKGFNQSCIAVLKFSLLAIR
ncbi:MAG: hypothetical protein P8X80_11345 [Desulfobacterales bacterium]